MIKRGKAIGPKRRALFRGLKKGTRDLPYLLAKTDGSRSAKAIEPRMRSGRTPDHSALIIGNTFSGTNGRSLISTKCRVVRGRRMAKTTHSLSTIAQRARRWLND